MGMITRSFEKIEMLFLRLSQVSVMGMMLLTAMDAFSRHFFEKSITGSYEITERYLMVIMVFLSISYVQKVDGHIRLDILFERFPQKLQDGLNIFYFILAAVFMFFIGYEGLLNTANAITNNLQLSGLINYPLWLSYVWIPIGSFLLVIRLLFTSIDLGRNLNKRNDAGGGESR